MPALEAAVVTAAKAVAQRAAQEWLSVRSAAGERNSDLTALIRSELPDRLVRRSFQRQVEAIADGVDRRLMTLVEQEYGGLSENDRAAALLEAVDTLKRSDFSDRAVFDAAADPIVLTKRIRQAAPCRSTSPPNRRRPTPTWNRWSSGRTWTSGARLW
ncbi:hypothetical protein [Nonomuraea sp. B19D2]|uniref:NACHT N-terminal Helical domain 1-containing protein n=1 Tax=Nonomuraea sp. B19D2 TaxID=3159561 RepID=UPI0032DABB68